MKLKMIKYLPLGIKIALGKYSKKNLFILGCSSDFSVFDFGFNNHDGSFRVALTCDGSRRLYYSYCYVGADSFKNPPFIRLPAGLWPASLSCFR